jgi:hypothetical protein
VKPYGTVLAVQSKTSELVSSVQITSEAVSAVQKGKRKGTDLSGSKSELLPVK